MCSASGRQRTRGPTVAGIRVIAKVFTVAALGYLFRVPDAAGKAATKVGFPSCTIGNPDSEFRNRQRSARGAGSVLVLRYHCETPLLGRSPPAPH